MSTDRIVRFAIGSSVPSERELQEVADDFLGAALKNSGWSSRVLYVTLRGKPQHALRRQVLASTLPEEQPSRWFEVWIGPDHVIVTTRMADDYTSAVAQRFAEIVARFWGGRVEP